MFQLGEVIVETKGHWGSKSHDRGGNDDTLGMKYLAIIKLSFFGFWKADVDKIQKLGDKTRKLIDKI